MYDAESGTDRYVLTYSAGEAEPEQNDDGWRITGPEWATIKQYLIVAGSVLGAVLHGAGGVALAYRCKLCTRHRLLGGFVGGVSVMCLNLLIRTLRNYMQKSEDRRRKRRAAAGQDPEIGGGLDATGVSLGADTARDLVRLLEDVRSCFEVGDPADETPLRFVAGNGAGRRFRASRGSQQSTPISVACPRAPRERADVSGNSGGAAEIHGEAVRALGAPRAGRQNPFAQIEMAPVH